MRIPPLSGARTCRLQVSEYHSVYDDNAAAVYGATASSEAAYEAGEYRGSEYQPVVSDYQVSAYDVDRTSQRLSQSQLPELDEPASRDHTTTSSRLLLEQKG